MQLSYQKQYNYGVYCFDINTYLDYGNKIINYQQNNDIIVGYIDEIVITTKNNCEKDIIKYILENYPAIYIVSNYKDTISIRNYNNIVFWKSFILCFVISLFMSIIFFFMNKRTIEYNRKLIYELENYYIDRKSIKFLYRLLAFMIFVVIYLAILITNLFIQYTLYLNILASVCFVVIMVPLILSYLWFMSTRRNNDRVVL